MAGSVNREYEVDLVIKTDHYEEEISDIISAALEENGIFIEEIEVRKE